LVSIPHEIGMDTKGSENENFDSFCTNEWGSNPSQFGVFKHQPSIE